MSIFYRVTCDKTTITTVTVLVLAVVSKHAIIHHLCFFSLCSSVVKNFVIFVVVAVAILLFPLETTAFLLNLRLFLLYHDALIVGHFFVAAAVVVVSFLVVILE